jgi:hypothetical protein
MGLFDKVLRALAIADVVTPVTALVRSGTMIRIPREGSPTGNKIKKKLKRAGIKVRHVMVDPIRTEIQVSVDDEDAEETYRILG